MNIISLQIKKLKIQRIFKYMYKQFGCKIKQGALEQFKYLKQLLL